METSSAELSAAHQGFDERFVADGPRIDRYQQRLHIERYRFACRFTPGKQVLDLACGEGYGSAMIAKKGAKQVVGVDISAEAIAHASRKYVRSSLEYREGNAQALTIKNACFDAVISFETIEHLPDYRAYLSEVHRVLRPGGLYIVSTPNRTRESPGYGPNSPVPNPHHIQEFTREELLPVLEQQFTIVGVYGQGLLHPLFAPMGLVSAWRRVQTALHSVRLARFPIGHIGRRGVHAWAGKSEFPAYFVVVCHKKDV